MIISKDFEFKRNGMVTEGTYTPTDNGGIFECHHPEW
jgi:hypothetical protein